MRKKLLPSWMQCQGALFALMLTLGAWSSPELFAQSASQGRQAKKTVTGRVIDESGQSLIGATVTVPGTFEGTTTNIDGNYAISLDYESNQLTFSYLGYRDITVSIDGRSVVDAAMEPASTLMDEVVVVGYGVQKKATLTGAIEQVAGKTLESRAVTNVGLALQGQTPGLVVTRSSSRPGNEGLDFQIRGATSANGGSPLIVIDGVPAINSTSFQNLNMDDVQSITVLKDGSASIYGAKAANGVILVTTKRGSGKISVSYNFNMRFTTTGITAFSPNMSQYATIWLEANKQETIPNWWNWISEANMLKMQQGIEGIYTTNWGDIFLGDANRIEELFATRYSYQHNLSVSGGTERSDYRISAAYADNMGNLATAYDGQKQINLRLNYSTQMTDWLRMETATSMINTNTSSPSAGLDNSMYGYDVPFFPAKNPFGQWYANFGNVGDRQSVAATSDGGRDNKTNLTTRVDMKLIANIWKNISFEGMASLQNEEYRRERYVIPVQTYDWFGNPTATVIHNTKQSLIYPTDPWNIKAENNPGYATEANNMLYQYYSAMLRYSESFCNHNISAVAGIDAEKYLTKRLATAREFFEDNGVYDLELASGTQGSRGRKSQNGTYSYIARVNYDYANKYLLEVMGRRDGNSKFADGFRFNNFGSAMVGWVFTEESFMKFLDPVVSFGKVRFSIGSSGNDVGLNDFDYVSLINQSVTTLGNPATSWVSTTLANSGLISYTRTWERVTQKNIGADMNFFRNRMTATFDYFWKDNKGMLSRVTYPAVLGGSAPRTNSGHLNVKGWELNLGWRDRMRDFSYYVNFNLSDTRSLLKQMEGMDSYGAGKNATVNGYPLNSYFLYRTDGFFADQAEVDRYYALYQGGGSAMTGINKGGATELRPGDVKRADLNGDYKISSDGSEASDLQYLGDASPHYVFGFTVGGSWKGFDLNLMFQGVGKQYIMRTGWMAYPFYAQYTNQNPTFLGKTWTVDNPDAEYPRLTSQQNRAKWNYENNDYMLQNNRYIRLKSLIAGYTLPKRWTRKVKLEKVRVYFSGNDLWETTSIKDGFDPEMGETSQVTGYPYGRTWSFGLNLDF